MDNIEVLVKVVDDVDLDCDRCAVRRECSTYDYCLIIAALAWAEEYGDLVKSLFQAAATAIRIARRLGE